MINTVFVCMLAILPEIALAQALPTTTPPPPERITKVIRIRYGNAGEIAAIVGHNAPVTADGDNTLKAVILKGSSIDVATAEKTIRELDTEPAFSRANDVEVIVYVIGATNKASTSLTEIDLPEIRPVVKQLRSIFPYMDYRLFGAVLIRSQQGKKAKNNGVMSIRFDDKPSPSSDVYGITYDSANISTEGSKTTIHLQNFHFSARVAVNTSVIPSTTQYQVFSVDTQSDIDVGEGQKVVVGKANIATGDSALFIVLSAKLAE